MKFIRELTFGPPKCWKTGSKVSTYPRPLLVLSIDRDGLSVIQEPLTPIDPSTIEQWCKKPTTELPPLSYIDFYDKITPQVMDAFTIQGNSKSFGDFISVVNKLVTVGCPWRTVILDGITGLDDIVKAHNAIKNPGSLGSALKWASLVGEKVKQIIDVMCTIKAHTVFLCHATQPEKDEDVTGQIQVTTVMTSRRLRALAGGLVSQFFYQEMKGGKPVCFTTDYNYVKGIGARWPQGLQKEVSPTFDGIYGQYFKQNPQ